LADAGSEGVEGAAMAIDEGGGTGVAEEELRPADHAVGRALVGHTGVQEGATK